MKDLEQNQKYVIVGMFLSFKINPLVYLDGYFMLSFSEKVSVSWTEQIKLSVVLRIYIFL